MDLQEILVTKVLPPAVTGALGAVGTLWKFTHGITSRVSKLEGAVAALRERQEAYDRGLSHKGVSLLNGRDHADRSDTARVQSCLERCAVLEARIGACEVATREANEAFRTFVKEQRVQWHDMTRTLGQIEGYLRAASLDAKFPFHKSPPR